MTGRLALVLIALVLAMAPRTASAAELLMFEQPGCHWCERWDVEIAPIYPKTSEGQAAPLRRLDIHAPVPGDVILLRTAFYTPTFVLIRDGRELARLEGYPGEDFFWGLLEKMLTDHAVPLDPAG